jgi:(1->4)-alpha-D-glucan 1-alpha-D-glucosylmutase
VTAAPTTTYRLQVHAEFGFDDVARTAPYLARLGVTHAYLSPLLQAAPGSRHGYDVVDHTQLSADAGGEPAFRRMVEHLHAAGLRAIADLVPNHMAVPTPARLNQPLWALLRDGPDSAAAGWFDVDWSPGQVLMPVLGSPVGDELVAGTITLDTSGPEPVLRYSGQEFPVRPGTAGLALPDLLARQWYRLAWWRVASEELNYRRFFDVTALPAIRVEDPAVFDATHELIVDLIRDGSLQGLRIDHPDGLVDPRGYLRRLAAATGGAWVAVEKILEGQETLPADWPCAGTTGYDALNVVGGVFADPAGRRPLETLLAEMDGGPGDLDVVITRAKTLVVEYVLAAETNRLLRLLTRICAGDLALRDHTAGALRAALTALLVTMDRYRAYAVPGETLPRESAEVLDRFAAAARAALVERAAGERAAGERAAAEQAVAALDALHALATDTTSEDPLRDEFVVRFQQTCGPVMAKGIEDTAFYRWNRLIALNEVGADPHAFGYTPAEFHELAARLARDWPATMTTLSTHDTKRSEDARARLLTLTEVPRRWAEAVRHWNARARAHLPAGGLPPGVAYVLWQTLVAVWTPTGPPDVHRLLEYLRKAGREAKSWTAWTSPDAEKEDGVERFARAVLLDTDIVDAIEAFVRSLDGADRVIVLGQKLLQLTMPGVADVYQGCEIVDRSLVDPDNRRPVDYARRSDLLDRLDSGSPPASFDGSDRLDAEKLLVMSRALRLRRDHPEWFTAGGYTPIETSSRHALAFGRGSLGPPDGVRSVTVVTRLPVALETGGGWADSTAAIPPGGWRDVLTDRSFSIGPDGVRLADLLSRLPVVLLVRTA